MKTTKKQMELSDTSDFGKEDNEKTETHVLSQFFLRLLSPSENIADRH